MLETSNASTSAASLTQNPTPPQALWLQPGKLTTRRLENFVSTILPTSVQIQLNQPFGKDSLHQSFYAAKSFCHILLPLLKSGFLSCRATKVLEKASYRVRQLQQLRKKYVPLDFRSLQGYQTDWENTATIREDWKAMTSACALHYNGDMATVVRFIGGPHVNQHIDIKKVLAKLKPVLTLDVYDDVHRILTTGAPALQCGGNSRKFQCLPEIWEPQVSERKSESIRKHNRQTEQARTDLDHGPSISPFYLEHPPNAARTRRHPAPQAQTTSRFRL
ncbi:hypothetical protein MHU86_19746 [Fragilaria crotonensis]|nr:hypothetical protein MHU86_19746 [Fragilaria crotonensis]